MKPGVAHEIDKEISAEANTIVFLKPSVAHEIDMETSVEAHTNVDNNTERNNEKNSYNLSEKLIEPNEKLDVKQESDKNFKKDIKSKLKNKPRQKLKTKCRASFSRTIKTKSKEDKTAAHQYSCSFCDKVFRTQSNRGNHCRRVHNAPNINDKKIETDNSIITNEANSSQYPCSFCKKGFSTSSNRLRHQRLVHGSIHKRLPYKPTRVICNVCSEKQPPVQMYFFSLFEYRNHLLDSHAIESNKIDFEFSCEKEFLAWRKRLQDELGVTYVKHRGSKRSKNITKNTYFCETSGHRKSKPLEERKRAPKKDGTYKLGLYCTSAIYVLIKSDGKLDVTLYLDHRDHDLGLSVEEYRERIEAIYKENQNHHLTVVIEECQRKIKDYIMSTFLPTIGNIKDHELLESVYSNLKKDVSEMHTSTYHINGNTLPVQVMLNGDANEEIVKKFRLCSSRKKRKTNLKNPDTGETRELSKKKKSKLKKPSVENCQESIEECQESIENCRESIDLAIEAPISNEISIVSAPDVELEHSYGSNINDHHNHQTDINKESCFDNYISVEHNYDHGVNEHNYQNVGERHYYDDAGNYQVSHYYGTDINKDHAYKNGINEVYTNRWT